MSIHSFFLYEAPPKWFAMYAGEDISPNPPVKPQDAFLIRPGETVSLTSLICACIESRPAVIQQWFINDHRIDTPDPVHEECNCSNIANCSGSTASLQNFHPPVTMKIRHITTENCSKELWVCALIFLTMNFLGLRLIPCMRYL